MDNFLLFYLQENYSSRRLQLLPVPVYRCAHGSQGRDPGKDNKYYRIHWKKSVRLKISLQLDSAAILMCCASHPVPKHINTLRYVKLWGFGQCCGYGSVGSVFFGPPGSGSITTRYGSGPFFHQAKIVRKTLIPTVLWLLYAFSNTNKQKNFDKKYFLFLS
jgi:hypothetical protein